MRKILLIPLLLTCFFVKAQTPVNVSQPQKFLKYIIGVGSIKTDSAMAASDSSTRVPNTKWAKQNFAPITGVVRIGDTAVFARKAGTNFTGNVYVQPVIDNTKSVVIRGNSITYGFDAIPFPTGAYSYRFATLQNVAPDVVGISGATIDTVLNANFNAAWPVYNDNINFAVIQFGTNELGRGISPSQYAAKLGGLIDSLHTLKGYPLNKIVVVGTTLAETTSSLEPYAIADSTITVQKGAIYVETYHYMLQNGGYNLLTPARVHFTTACNILIANLVQQTVGTSSGNLTVRNTVNAGIVNAGIYTGTTVNTVGVSAAQVTATQSNTTDAFISTAHIVKIQDSVIFGPPPTLGYNIANRILFVNTGISTTSAIFGQSSNNTIISAVSQASGGKLLLGTGHWAGNDANQMTTSNASLFIDNAGVSVNDNFHLNNNTFITNNPTRATGTTGYNVLVRDTIDGSIKRKYLSDFFKSTDITATSPIFWNPSTNVISSQAADASAAGHVTTGTQTMTGAKTFSTSLTTPTITLTQNVDQATSFLMSNYMRLITLATPVVGYTAGTLIQGLGAKNLTLIAGGDVSNAGNSVIIAAINGTTGNRDIGFRFASTSSGTTPYVVLGENGGRTIFGGDIYKAALPLGNIADSVLTIHNGVFSKLPASSYTVNPLTTTGDIIYGVGSTPTRLGVGSSGALLNVSGGLPVWSSISTILGYTPANGANYAALSGVNAFTNTNSFIAGTLFANYLKITNGASSVSINATSTTAARNLSAPDHDGTIATTSDLPITGRSTTTGTATTVVTVTIGTTMANTLYVPHITPRDLLTAVNYFVSAKTTTTFDITFVSALTGSIDFDWTVAQYNP